MSQFRSFLKAQAHNKQHNIKQLLSCALGASVNVRPHPLGNNSNELELELEHKLKLNKHTHNQTFASTLVQVKAIVLFIVVVVVVVAVVLRNKLKVTRAFVSLYLFGALCAPFTSFHFFVGIISLSPQASRLFLFSLPFQLSKISLNRGRRQPTDDDDQLCAKQQVNQMSRWVAFI